MNNDQHPDARATSDDCGCAPTAAERRALWPTSPITRRGAITVGALSAIALSAFGISASTQSAHAADYPSWDDVQRAKASESAKGAEISRIETLIQSLTQRAAAAEAAARTAGDEFYEAQQAFFDQAAKAADLQSQADDQSKIADETARKAGQVATQLYRNGGDDAALELFFSDSADADGLLSRLGGMDKLLGYNRTVYENAASARDAAQSLSDQATTARDERDRLQKIAEEKMIKAQQAADAAQAALDEKQANLQTLEAQLAALKDNTAATVAGYQEGERVRKAEEERRRKAEAERRRQEAERARKAAEEAAKNNQGGGGGGRPSSGGGSGSGGSGSGAWRRPHGGYISSGYGPRPPQFSNGVWRSTYHRGTDFANGCGAPIYAASSGRVDAAFYNGGYGNYVRIQHGNGIATGYAHIARFAVSSGQHVSAGQVIAYAGNTGASQGCHVHFEVYTGGGTVNPYNFLAARGAI
ncbi:Membrane proteins related to metalloendopeptidases [Microbacterium esteraromaticum]|uniref:Membrane proteins related to metalloendopeptidases n=1 Tax=Microbacterium esteraromaticum TaxID=57043 RepID=A0A1R4KP67_9MICO|nr:M23 family metallopeptidase [Microbacterium esteraromaticum]SJN46062.1 Membrane proteins related to metalloendopeptidases [Microbacterium esteraromaticum]